MDELAKEIRNSRKGLTGSLRKFELHEQGKAGDGVVEDSSVSKFSNFN